MKYEKICKKLVPKRPIYANFKEPKRKVVKMHGNKSIRHKNANISTICESSTKNKRLVIKRT